MDTITEQTIVTATMPNSEVISTLLEAATQRLVDARASGSVPEIAADVIDDTISTVEENKLLWETTAYFESERAADDIESLCWALNALAPAGYRFGSHPDDRTRYGFWRVEKNT